MEEEPHPGDKAVAELIHIEIKEALVHTLPKMKLSQVRTFAYKTIMEILEKYYDLGYLAPIENPCELSDSYAMQIIHSMEVEMPPELES